MVLHGEFGNSSAAGGGLYGGHRMLFTVRNGRAAEVGTAPGNEAGVTYEAESVGTMHKYDSPGEQGKSLIVIGTVVIAD